MLYRDVANVLSDNNSCNAVVNSTTIYGFSNSNRTRRTYTLIEDKYYYTGVNNSTYGYDISSYVCSSNEQLQALPSFANYLTPIYGICAFSLAFCSFAVTWFAIKSIFGRRV